jgi:hypothetical protein
MDLGKIIRAPYEQKTVSVLSPGSGVALVVWVEGSTGEKDMSPGR